MLEQRTRALGVASLHQRIGQRCLRLIEVELGSEPRAEPGARQLDRIAARAAQPGSASRRRSARSGCPATGSRRRWRSGWRAGSRAPLRWLDPGAPLVALAGEYAREAGLG